MQTATKPGRSFAILAVLMLAAILGAITLLVTGRDSPVTLSPTDSGLSDARSAFLQARESLRGGAPQAFDALEQTVARLDSRGDDGLTDEQALLNGQIRSSASAVRKARQDILAVFTAAAEIEKLTLDLSQRVQELKAIAGQTQPVAGAQLGRLKTLIEALPPQIRSLALGPAKPTDTANQLGQTEIESSQIILGLQSGDAELGLKPLASPRAADLLGGLNATKDRIFARVRDARARADRLDLVNQASRQLDAVAGRILVPSPAAASAVVVPGLGDRGLLAIGLLAVAVLLLAVMAWRHGRGAGAARASDPQAQQSERNQQAILRLLDELSSLADGDLTVQATVNEDITGAIADSINYAVEALRELVTTINESAILLDGAAKQAETTGQQLSEASEAQSRQVDAASQAIARMAGSIEEVGGDAERSSDVARHSVDVAHKGGEAVRRTIEGMNAIRETIQETSKRIKRLGESSQEIGNIVELINDIADQTNILALNASIQASMAGEAGRGFAVVADEVQRLAERSANATKQIEVLVRTIQADTNEAIVSMERSTTDVVGGALLAENAGAALEEIEQVSNQIASLVQNISSSAREQAGAAAAVIRNVEGLQQINSQTAAGTSATTASLAELAELAAQLRRSVAGFRLPAGGSEVGRSRLAAGSRGEHGEETRDAGAGTKPPRSEADEFSAKRLRRAGKKTA